MILENDILQMLAYSDVFDYPVTVDEIRRFLAAPVEKHDVEQCLSKMKNIDSKDGYYYLIGRDAIVALRKRRESVSRKAFKNAMFYGRVLGVLPFIRMVALTGSLAVRNSDKNGDYDYMLVVKPGRLWLARAFSLVLNRIANLFGETLCPNLIVSENTLAWNSKNLYSAREICQMEILTGRGVYHKFRAENTWVETYFPNWNDEICLAHCDKKADPPARIQKFFEFFFDNKFGDYLEKWEMNRKITRFQNQSGFGVETMFSADICQGNFNHHGTITMDKFRRNLQALNIEFFDLPSQKITEGR